MRKGLLATSALFAFLCLGPAAADVAPKPGAPVPAVPDGFTMSIVATGLANPHNMVLGPDGYLWLTEQKAKRISRVNPKTGEIVVAVQIEDAVHSPGSQDGVLGIALHPDLLAGKGADYVYVSMTYAAGKPEPYPNATLIRRYTYDQSSQRLTSPVDIIKGLPSSHDHQSARLLIGPDRKLYYTIGDQGANQLAYLCTPNEAQVLPSADEVARADWRHYKGKLLRLNLDGSVPDDNPVIHGVKSHVYAWGFRNTQGMTFSPSGKLFSVNQGPNSDDTFNLIVAGGNYGWPNALGFRNDATYAYADFSSAKGGCAGLKDPALNGTQVPPEVPVVKQSEFSDPAYVAPLKTLFSLDAADVKEAFENPLCADKGLYYICWPTIAPSSVAYYAGGPNGIPGWEHSVLITSLKRGLLYHVRLDPSESVTIGEAVPMFRSLNRYREVVFGADGRTIYVATDTNGYGNTTNDAGSAAFKMQNPGSILAFTYSRPQ